MNLTSTNDGNRPRTVAIVAMGPSHADYMRECIAASGRFRVADETWAVNAMAGVIDHDRAIIMDDLEYFERAAREAEHLRGYGEWLPRHPGPIYTSRPVPRFPGSVAFPLDDIWQDLGFDYFNNTTAYALALAIHWRIPHIKLYGMDFTQGTAVAESGRACLEFWLAAATRQYGLKVTLPPSTTLCDQNTNRPLYGYSTPPGESRKQKAESRN
jgi:hypothetical protein